MGLSLLSKTHTNFLHIWSHVMQVEVNECIICHRPLIVTLLDDLTNKLQSNQ